MMDSFEITNTHCHHMEGHFFKDMSLARLVSQAYVAWSAPVDPLSGDEPPEAGWFEKVRFNSYFIALQRGLQRLYGIDEPLDQKNWPFFAEAVRVRHQEPDWHLQALRDVCRYRYIIQDSYWDPGSAHSDPLFKPVFRINMFMYFHNKQCRDHNGNNALSYLDMDEPFDTLDEYIDAVDIQIIDKKKSGSVALKNALAYDRDLLFTDETKNEANKLYEKLICGKGDDGDLYRLQNHVFFRICEMAASHDLPLQCHTGLGQLVNTNAMCLYDAIAGNPQTKFILFHGSYPYMEDVMALCHNMKNVYPDICWLPIISPSAAERFVSEIIEVGLSNVLCWGCDTWTSEESLGALLTAQDVFATVAARKVENGYFSLSNASDFLSGVFCDNARSIYALSG